MVEKVKIRGILAAFIACKESRASAEAAARAGGIDPSTITILSRRDDPSLQTFEDILAALPAWN